MRNPADLDAGFLKSVAVGFSLPVFAFGRLVVIRWLPSNCLLDRPPWFPVGRFGSRWKRFRPRYATTCNWLRSSCLRYFVPIAVGPDTSSVAVAVASDATTDVVAVQRAVAF